MPKYDRIFFMYKQLCSATCSDCAFSVRKFSSSSLSNSRRFSASFCCVAINCRALLNESTQRVFPAAHSTWCTTSHACCAFVLNNFYSVIVLFLQNWSFELNEFVDSRDYLQIICFWNSQAGNIVNASNIV